MDLSFISDDRLREMIERDAEELSVCLQHNAGKAAIVMTGSIIEAVLVDYFLAMRPSKRSEKDVLNAGLWQLIEWAEIDGFISSQVKSLAEVVRNYRNLIHPGIEYRRKQPADMDTADIARSLLHMIVEAIGDKYAETRGPTPEQVLFRIVSDPSFVSTGEHVVSEMLPVDRVRLFRAIPGTALKNLTELNIISRLVKIHDVLKGRVGWRELEAGLATAYARWLSGPRVAGVIYLNFFLTHLSRLGGDKQTAVESYLLEIMEKCEPEDRLAYSGIGLFRRLFAHFIDNYKFELLIDTIRRTDGRGGFWKTIDDSVRALPEPKARSLVVKLREASDNRLASMLEHGLPGGTT